MDVRLKPRSEVNDAKKYFFKEAIRKHTPALTCLYHEVMPAYRTLTPDLAKRSYSIQQPRPIGPNRPRWQKGWFGSEVDLQFAIEVSGDMPISWSDVERGATKTREAAELKDRLEEWAQKFNLAVNHHVAEPWLLTAAVITLFSWSRSAPNLNDLKWGWVPLAILNPPLRAFKFSDPGWAFEEESSDEFEARIRDLLAAQLAAYQNVVLREANEQGWAESPTPTKKTRTHAHWLTLYHLLGWSPADIVGHSRTDPSTVFKAVKVYASEVGLKLRPSKKGFGTRKPYHEAPTRS